MSSSFGWPTIVVLFSEGDKQVLETGTVLPSFVFGSFSPFCRALDSEAFPSSLSSLPSLTSHWYLVTLKAEFWIQPQSFPFVPLPFQETLLAGVVQQEVVVLR